jgi:hypothetical protein
MLALTQAGLLHRPVRQTGVPAWKKFPLIKEINNLYPSVARPAVCGREEAPLSQLSQTVRVGELNAR